MAACASAAPAFAQSFTLDLGATDATGPNSTTGRIVQLLLLMTVLSIAPAILMMVTSFTRIVIVLSILRRGVGVLRTRGRAPLPAEAFCKAFGLPRAHSLLHDFARDVFRARNADQRTRLTGGDLSFLEHLQHGERQIEQAQRVGHMRARLADDFADTFLCVPELLDQPLIPARFLDGREILTLQVFDQCDFERLGVGQIGDVHRNFMHLRALGRTPAPAAPAKTDAKLT